MSALLGRPEQAVSATAMARSFGARLKDVSSGDLPHLVIFKDNEPAAVLVGVAAFQAMQDELEDLRAERLAIERLATLDERNTISHEEMERRFIAGAD
ncbi:type II toxin-antitoxin system Phd/YefM family antitoxin [Pseudomonas aeruginosa]